MSIDDYISFDMWSDYYIPDKFDTSYTVISIISETKKAWLIVLRDKDKTLKRVWLPKSKCSLDENRRNITIPAFLARAKDFNQNYLDPGDY